MFSQVQFSTFLGNFSPFPMSNILLRYLHAWFFSSTGSSNGISHDEDLALIQAALSGDDGFEKLVKNFENMVYRVAYRFLNHEADASDVAQEVFLKIHNALPRFRGESSLKTWIYAITANTSRNLLRSRTARSKFQVFTPMEKGEQGRDPIENAEDMKSPTALRNVESDELKGAIQRAVQTLPLEYKEAVVLRDFEGLEYEQIAQVMKIGIGTVKSRISRGRSILKNLLKDWL